MQLLGETSKALLQDDEKLIAQWLDHFKNNERDFWLVIAYKPQRYKGPKGEFVMTKGVRAYYTEPPPIIGTRQLLLNGRQGRVLKERNYPHDGPLDLAKFMPLVGHEIAPSVGITQIAGAYEHQL